MVALSSADYRGLLDVVGVIHENDGPDPFPEPVLDELRHLIGCAFVTYRDWDGDSIYRHTVSGLALDEVVAIWDGYPAVRPRDPLPGVCKGADPRVATGVARTFSDYVSLRELRRLDLHAEMCRPLGIDYVMKLFLPAPRGVAGFVFDSDRHDFTSRDRALLDALAPHLALVRRRHLAARATERNDAFSALTRREREVVRLVAAGLTNREIAAALFIAPGTVRKHLDNVYAKLGTRSRAATVGRIFQPENPRTPEGIV